MTLNELQALKITAFKANDKNRITVLNDIIMLVQKEQTKGKTKIEATEDMVQDCAIKVQKTYEEMVATCPVTEQYSGLLECYKRQLEIAKEYAPQLISDFRQIYLLIENILRNTDIEIIPRNKGKIMKIVMPQLKGKVDMGVANKVISSIFVS